MRWKDQVRAALAETAVRYPLPEQALSPDDPGALGIASSGLACAAWCRHEARASIDWDELEETARTPDVARLLEALRNEDTDELRDASEVFFRDVEHVDGVDPFTTPSPPLRTPEGSLSLFDVTSTARVMLALRRVLLLITEGARDLFEDVEEDGGTLGRLIDELGDVPEELLEDPGPVLLKPRLLARIEAAIVPLNEELAARFSRARRALTVVLQATPLLAPEHTAVLGPELAVAHAAARDFTSAVALHLDEVGEDELDIAGELAKDVEEIAAFDQDRPAARVVPLLRRSQTIGPLLTEALERGERAAILRELQGLFDIAIEFPDGPEWAHLARRFITILFAAVDEAAETLDEDEATLRAHGLEQTLAQLG